MRDIFHVDKDLLKESDGRLCSRHNRGLVGNMAKVRIISEGLDAEAITGVGFFVDLLGEW